jgi:hypothetical protein
MLSHALPAALGRGDQAIDDAVRNQHLSGEYIHAPYQNQQSARTACHFRQAVHRNMNQLLFFE